MKTINRLSLVAAAILVLPLTAMAEDTYVVKPLADLVLTEGKLSDADVSKHPSATRVSNCVALSPFSSCMPSTHT